MVNPINIGKTSAELELQSRVYHSRLEYTSILTDLVTAGPCHAI